MNKCYGLYHDDKKIGVLSVDYNIGPKKFDVSARAYDLDPVVQLSTPMCVHRNYKTAVMGAVRMYAEACHLTYDAVDVRDEPAEGVWVEADYRDADPNWQQSRIGRRVWSYDTRPQDIHLAEIAYGLREGRFACQTLGLYTYAVGQHSVHASHLGDQRPHARMAKLLHDAHEATLKDMPRPLRNQPGMEDYNGACDARQRVINVWAGLDPDAHHMYDVKQADMIMLATERRDVMAPCDYLWQKNPHQPADRRLTIWDQPFVVYAFLVTFRGLAKTVCPNRYDEANALLVEHIRLCREHDIHFNLDELASMAVL